LYLDYHLIVQTTSAQEAISILICLYNIFEIKFTRHSRGIHLLYGVMFQDQNELSKSLRKLLLSWDYIIKNKTIVHQRQTTTTTTVSNINMIQSTISTETNVNDSNVLEEIDSVQNQQLNIINQDPEIDHSLNHTQELGKSYRILQNGHPLDTNFLN
jgi:hypothetical protein